MNVFTIASFVLSLCLFIPQCVQILGGMTQNFATWLLWLAINVVATGTLIVQHGNYLPSAAISAGDVFVCLCILKSWDFYWTRIETFASVLVSMCILTWIILGPRAGTIMSTSAYLIAGLPQIISTYRWPWYTSIPMWLSWFAVSGLSVLGGKIWSIAERLYPSAVSLYCLALSLVATRNL